MSLATVDLPLPVAPTSAIDSPGSTVRSKPVEHGPTAAVAEGDAVEAHAAATRLGSRTGLGGSTTSASVARISWTRCADAPARPAWATIIPSIRKRPDQQHDVGVEGDEVAELELAVEHEVAAVAEHRDQPEVRQQLERRPVAGADPGRLERDLVEVVGLGAEPCGLDVLGAEPLDHPHARHRLLDHRGELGRLLLDADHRRVQLRGEALGEELTNGSIPSASSASSQLVRNRMTVTAVTVTAFEIVSGIRTMKFWTCCRSVLARLISWPVCASSWNEKCRRWRWANIRSRRTASDQRASRNA